MKDRKEFFHSRHQPGKLFILPYSHTKYLCASFATTFRYFTCLKVRAKCTDTKNEHVFKKYADNKYKTKCATQL